MVPRAIIANEIYETLRNNGPLWSLREEWCSQAFQQAHAIRAMLAAHRVEPNSGFLEEGVNWARMTIHMQGTHGHPDAYSKGTGIRLKNGVPLDWFVADCATVAVAMLDVADLLDESDPLHGEILDSVTRFADYIMDRWTLPDGSFSLGFMGFESLDEKAYHCANSQSNLFLWPLARMTGRDKYRQQALTTTTWMADWSDYDGGYHGSPLHNRSYNGESMFVSLRFLESDQEELARRLKDNISTHIVQWARERFGTPDWMPKGRLSSPKDPLLLMTLLLHANDETIDAELAEIIEKARAITETKVSESWDKVELAHMSGASVASHVLPAALAEHVSKAKYYTTDGITGMAMAVAENPGSLFPLAGAIKN